VSPRLHLIVPGPLDQRTGGYLYDARMVEGLRRLGWTVDVISLEGAFPRADARAQVSMEESLAALPNGSRVVIDGLAMGGLPDLIRDHGERLRIVSLVHHPLADETGLSPSDEEKFRDSEREALKHCAGVVVTSPFTARRLAGYGVPERRIRAVPPGTAPAAWATGPGEGAPPQLICVGTLTQRKGHDTLVAALDLVRDLDWTCVCAGSLDRDLEHTRAVRDQVAAAGLANRIRFLGEVDEDVLSRLYDASSMFVLPSRYEGYGMAFTEALARGLPVVSTTGGAIPFTVPAEAGILVRPGDAPAFAAALRSLLDGLSTRRERMAAAARSHAATLPSWEDSAAAFALAVDELTR
jgi:glycosyltransferase involved in cell wall biosynthesis